MMGEDVRMAEDMSRYAQYLQQPARCATFHGFEKIPQFDCYQRFLKTKVSTFVTLRQIFGASDFGPQPHLDRDGFHERTSTPSFQASQAALKQTETHQKWINNVSPLGLL